MQNGEAEGTLLISQAFLLFDFSVCKEGARERAGAATSLHDLKGSSGLTILVPCCIAQWFCIGSKAITLHTQQSFVCCCSADLPAEAKLASMLCTFGSKLYVLLQRYAKKKDPNQTTK